MRPLEYWTALLFAAGISTLAHAEDACQPAKLITSVDMRLAGDGRIYVPAEIGGAKKSMLVDTGGFFSEITQQTVDELKLPTRHTRLELIGVSGDTTNTVTRAPFLFGNLRADAADFMVLPDADGFADEVTDAAGILAPNLMHSYDVDIDFGTMKLSFFSQERCGDGAAHWVERPVVAVPMTLDPSDHIQIPVELDGRRYSAILDTGATSSVLDIEVAKNDFGLTPGDAETPEFGRLLRSPASKTYSHRFKSLSLAGISVANPTMHLIPDLMRNKMASPDDSLKGGSRLGATTAKPGFGDLILGMNVIRQWHVYIAYKEQKLYLARAPIAVSVETTKATDEPAAVQAQPGSAPLKPGDLRPH